MVLHNPLLGAGGIREASVGTVVFSLDKYI